MCKSAPRNIPYDSPWLIFPQTETPIISHKPNSTRMACCYPRGQFSGHFSHTTAVETNQQQGGRSCGGRYGCTSLLGRWVWVIKPSYSINRQDSKMFFSRGPDDLVLSRLLKAMWPKFANGQKMSFVSDKDEQTPVVHSTIQDESVLKEF